MSELPAYPAPDSNVTATKVPLPDRPLELPPGATFYRHPADGSVMMCWPNTETWHGGIHVQALNTWVQEYCPPSTTYDVEEAVAPSGERAIIGVRLACQRAMKYDDPVFAEFDPAVKPSAPRVFHLVRYDDVSGISGTGIVAQGMQARDGAIALRWCVPGMPASWNLYESLEDMLRVVGHNGRTVVKWADGRD